MAARMAAKPNSAKGAGRNVVFLLPARSLDSWFGGVELTRRNFPGARRADARHAAMPHLVCLLRILLLLPVAACVVVAWLAAAVAATLWLVLVGPRRGAGSTRD